MVETRGSIVQTVRIGVNQYINSIETIVSIPTPGTYTFNAARLYGTVRLIQSQTQFTEVREINGLTGVWAGLSDGVNPQIAVTSKTPGADLSGAQSGTMFFKGQNSLAAAVVLLSDKARTWECTGPFCADGTSVVMNAANGLDTFLTVNLTIGGPLDVTAVTSFTWESYPVGRLELLVFP